MDPPRWWPSGVPQGWAIVGSALTTFVVLSRIPGVSPRGRVLGALASGGVSVSQITYNSAIENSLGFNRFMWGLSEYRRTGVWPSLEHISKTTSDKQITDFANEAMKHSDQSKVEVVVSEVVDNCQKLLPSPNLDFSNLIEKFSNLIFKETMQLFKPVQIQGFFDDLIGQRMFIEIILFFTSICLIVLFIIFIINLIFLLNKDKIIKKFNNKFIRFYIKYQTALSRITLFYVPIFIFVGLFTLFKGILWLITHQIPYESLGIDLHQFISSSTSPDVGGTDIVASLGLIFSSNKIKYNKNIKQINIYLKSPFFFSFLYLMKGTYSTFNNIYKSLFPLLSGRCSALSLALALALALMNPQAYESPAGLRTERGGQALVELELGVVRTEGSEWFEGGKEGWSLSLYPLRRSQGRLSCYGSAPGLGGMFLMGRGVEGKALDLFLSTKCSIKNSNRKFSSCSGPNVRSNGNYVNLGNSGDTNSLNDTKKLALALYNGNNNKDRLIDKKINLEYTKIVIPFRELTEIKFLNTLLFNLKLNSLYTILYQYNLYSDNINYMLGPQVGINVQESHDLRYYKDLFIHLLDLLEITMSKYQLEEADFIVIHLKEIVLEGAIKTGQISKIKLNKGIVKVGETKKKFNSQILPLTINEKYFGSLLEGSIRLEFLNQIIAKLQDKKIPLSSFSSTSTDSASDQLISRMTSSSTSSSTSLDRELEVPSHNGVNRDREVFNSNNTNDSVIDVEYNKLSNLLANVYFQIKFLEEVKKNKFFKVFVSFNKKYLIISYLNKAFSFIRIIFKIETGKFLFLARDILNLSLAPVDYKNLALLSTSRSTMTDRSTAGFYRDRDRENWWLREIGNISVVLDNGVGGDIIYLSHKIKLDAIKYQDHKRLINPEYAFRIEKKNSSLNLYFMSNSNYGVFDLETFIDTDDKGNSFSRVFALGFKTNNEVKTYYLTDHFSNDIEGSANLVLKCLDDMLIPEYNNYKFYVHNLGKFDVIFLNKILSDYNEYKENKYILEPLYRDNQIIRLIVKLNTPPSHSRYPDSGLSRKVKLSFVDSLNLLNSSLEKLGVDYKVNTSKGIFPYNFVNKNNLNYEGPTPDIKYYNKNIDLGLYNSCAKLNWNLRKETLIYLNKDLTSLFEILNIFQRHLFEDHNLEMTEHLTISSLAKTKFLKYYLKKSKIPLINSNNLFNFLFSAYFGGITEVYKPFGKDLIYLDVNSLYPSAALNPMPGIECFWIESYSEEGLDLSRLFGVFMAEIQTNDLYIGLLPVRTKSGIIFPKGKFEGTWTSVELKFAESQGYKIKVTKGYQFNEEYNIFNNYVNELSIKKDTLKGSQRQVVKSLLNNLLGRFGLNFVKPITRTVKKKELDKILATKEIKTFKQVNENSFIVTYKPLVNKAICESHNLDYQTVILNENKGNILNNIDVFQDTSIIISAFTTAYARVHMHKTKLEILAKGGSIYYSDTDSLVTNLTLNQLEEIIPDRIGNTLGKLKLEYNIKEAYFISNKTYALKLDNEEVIHRAKGVTNYSLSFSDYKSMYLNSESIQGTKISGIINYSLGSVLIKTSPIEINWNSYTKREKIYDSKTNLWIDTEPLYIDTLTKSITLYKPKNIIKYEN
uniref:Probable DNA polymerase n=1 Tax=Termitomyces sp. DKA64 TaxID=2811476 RepID=A0A8H2S9U2_9AGAR|nr:DNA polymerase [Termitomyces sp. DKA64]